MSASRLFAISDIHGTFNLLQIGLDWIAKNTESAKIVFTGDYVDRGPNSKSVIECLMAGPTRSQDEWVCLKGNHEDLLVKALTRQSLQDQYNWVRNGGLDTQKSYDGEIPEHHIQWMRDLPLFHETENYWFVHAGLHPNLHPSEHPSEHLLWMRYWESEIEHGSYEKHVVYGHTPDVKVMSFAHCTCIDTAAAYGGMLTIAEFDPEQKAGPVRLIQVDSKSELLMVRSRIEL